MSDTQSISSVRFEGDLRAEAGRQAYHSIVQRFRSGEKDIRVDLAAVSSLDTLGAAWLMRAAQEGREKGVEIEFAGSQGQVAEILELYAPMLENPAPKPPPQPEIVERIGAGTLDLLAELRDFFILILEAIYWTFIGPFEGRKFRWKAFIEEIWEIGYRGIVIVGIINYTLGLVITLLSAEQLRKYGATIYSADLVILAFTRELAPVFTAIVVSARSGAAITAEIATMKVQEELDALRGMGQNVTRFLLTPKILATVLAVPFLTSLAMATGVLGGLNVGTLVLNHTARQWWNQTVNIVAWTDFFQGWVKAFVFGIVIVLVACHNGLRVSGGSRGVGLVTTRCVVMNIFLIIAVDTLFSVFFFFRSP